MPIDENDDGAGAILVTAKRESKPSPQPLLIISNSDGGFHNPVIDWFYQYFRENTQINTDPSFDAKTNKLIREAIKRLANDPRFADAYNALLEKRVEIDIHPVTRSDQIQGTDEGGTVGKNSDGTVSAGSTLQVYIRTSEGEPYGPVYQAEIIVHELIHALGNASWDARLDAPNSTWDAEIMKDLFRDYDFASESSNQSTGLADLVGPSSTNSPVVGSNPASVLVTSEQGSAVSPIGGGNVIYTGPGNNSVQAKLGGDVDIVKVNGGRVSIVLPTGVSLQDVSLVKSNENDTTAVLIHGRTELSIENVVDSQSDVFMVVGSQTVSLDAVPATISDLEGNYDVASQYVGEFDGGFVASAAISSSAPLTYRLAATSGDYASEAWSVDQSTGVISASFYKPDMSGSQFTFFNLVAGNGAQSTIIDMTLRWVYSNEYSPGF